jgi:hypothetical protein
MEIYRKSDTFCARFTIPELAAGKFDATCSPTGSHASDVGLSDEEFADRLAADLARQFVTRLDSHVAEGVDSSTLSREILTEPESSVYS